MRGPGIAVLGVLLGLLVAMGLVVAIVRGGRGRRKPLLAALIAVLVLTAGGGVAWVRAGSGSPAPVDDNLTLFTQGLDCSRVTGDCGLPNALYAVRADNGSVRWEVVETKPAYFVGSAPLFDDGVVYTYTYTGPADTIGSMANYLLTAWRGRDGAQLWHTRILAETSVAPLTYVAGDQLVVLEINVATSGGQPTWGFLHLRVSDGAMVGTTPLPGPFRSPAVADNVVYECLLNGTIIATRVSDGAPVWRASASGTAGQTCADGSALTEGGGVVFASLLAGSDSSTAGRTGQLLALNAINGQVLWRYATPTPVPLAVGDGLVVLGEGNHSVPSTIVALQAADGTLAWRHPGFPPAPVVKGYIPNRTAAIGGGLVLVGGGGFTLWALRTNDGSSAWQLSEDRHSFESAGIVDGTVFVRSQFAGYGTILPSPFVDGNSYFSALRASDGTPYWQTSLGSLGGLVMGGV
jgi:outer membrane protein assembly factor BamB